MSDAAYPVDDHVEPLRSATDSLVLGLKDLRFAEPVTHVYNPLEYARASWDTYLERYGAPPKEVMFVGMNPGPWGMAQTGVPFGEIEHARDWLGCEAPVAEPLRQNPRRPIRGYAETRSEVSGRRLWGWARRAFGTAEAFFARFFVYNYCPLVFMEATGRNRTPDKLPKAERDRLFEICDEALQDVTAIVQPALVVGVGRFAEHRSREALRTAGVRFGAILHPSPASPAANRGWARQAVAQLRALGVELPEDSPTPDD